MARRCGGASNGNGSRGVERGGEKRRKPRKFDGLAGGLNDLIEEARRAVGEEWAAGTDDVEDEAGNALI